MISEQVRFWPEPIFANLAKSNLFVIDSRLLVCQLILEKLDQYIEHKKMDSKIELWCLNDWYEYVAKE